MDTALAILAVVGGFGLLGLLVGLDARHHRAVGGHRPGGYPADPYAGERPSVTLGPWTPPRRPQPRPDPVRPAAATPSRPVRPTPAARDCSTAA